MFRKDGGGVEKRLRRIVKGEQASLKLLEKQELELEKAVEDNGRMLEVKLNKQSPQEDKLQKEVDKLRERLDSLSSQIEKHRESRERNVEPFRVLDTELREKLKMVRHQLEAVRGMRDRAFSTSTINMSAPPLELDFSRFDIREDAEYGSHPSTPSITQPPSYNDTFRFN